jgi:hypothetical protein
MTIGHGGANNKTEARNGIKTTDEPTLACEMRGTGRNAESLAIPSTAKATRAFQNDESAIGGMYQSDAKRSEIATVITAASKSRKFHRSNRG